jgi:hypothetical protein
LVATWSVGTSTAQPGVISPPPALTPDEQALLARGEISPERHVLGSVGAGLLGLGIGQAIQGRWRARGWIFTLGERAGFGMIVAASIESDLDVTLVNALAIGGWVSFVGLHVWEVTDAIVVPGRHNRRVRDLRVKAGFPMSASPLRFDEGRGRARELGSGAIVELSFRY